jgi:serine/threonine-protein kinase
MFDPIVQLNAALEGRYRVGRLLGEGGMALVYLADDLRHGRKVALKVLKPDLTAALGAERFHAEIRTTANLHHPHILPLFDSGNAGGLLFFTMPYVQGETLRTRVEREGRLPIEEAVEIAVSVANALHAAHERGVVHRDVKPSNLLLSGGNTLVSDFGIAQAAADAGGTRLTQVGSSIGTAGYMSPEQASGDEVIDLRSDVYSLGCVLFEMIAGEPPYGGKNLVQVLSRQLTSPVPSLREARPEVPTDLDRAVARALAKDSSHRFQSMADFAEALRVGVRASAGRSGPDRERGDEPTVLVLPFANRSSDPEDEYFSDGLTDEVISDLAVISAIRVISRNSSAALKGTNKDTATLARELGITHLVTGSVRRSGNALRVAADLVEAATDSPIWSQKFAGTRDDVFGIQEEISRKIVSALEVRLTDAEDREVGVRSIDNPVAFDCYLRARQVMYQWTPEAQRQALLLVTQAMDIVGETAILLATKAQIHWNVVQTGLGPEQGLEDAAHLVSQALELEPGDSLATYVRGLVSGSRGETLSALADLRRALDLRPSDGNVVLEFCRYSLSAGLDGRGDHVSHLLRTDPLTPQTHLLDAMMAYYDGRRGEAAPPARRALEIAADPSMLHVVAGLMIADAGFPEEALAILDRVMASEAADPHRQLAAFFRHALAGDGPAVDALPMEDLVQGLTNEHMLRMIADGYALLGRHQDAIRVLREALRRGFINYPNLSSRAVTLEDLRGIDDFQSLLAEMEPRWRAMVDWERGLGV